MGEGECPNFTEREPPDVIVLFWCGVPTSPTRAMPQAAAVQVALVAHASITILDLPLSTESRAATLPQPSTYIAQDPDGNIFLIMGPGAVTSVIAEFHP
jgi:hypothetical protein